MRKILSILILSVFLVGLVAPALVQGQEDLPSGCYLKKTGATWTGAKCPVPDATNPPFCDPTETGHEDCGMCCLLNIIYSVTDWIFYLMIVAVVIVFVIAGAMFMMAGGSTEKTKSAKFMMILGVVGLVIALVAKLVPSVVKLIVGM